MPKPAKPNPNSPQNNVSKTVKDHATPNLKPKTARTPHPQNKSGGADYPQATQHHPFDGDMTPRPRTAPQIPATPRPSAQIPTTPRQAAPIPATPKLPYEESFVEPENNPVKRTKLPKVGQGDKYSLEWFTFMRKQNKDALKETLSVLSRSGSDADSFQKHANATVVVRDLRQNLKNLRARFGREFPKQHNMFDD